MNTVEKILANKKKEIELKKSLVSIKELEERFLFKCPAFSLKNIFIKNKINIIAEYKRKSPSNSSINHDVSVNDIVKIYQESGVSGISVLTDSKYFGGSLEDLVFAKAAASLPILRKDFIVDIYQIVEAKAYGSDVILLIAAILTEKDIKTLSQFAHSLGLEVLLEVHDKKELEYSLMDSIDFIGVNNRNLKTMKIDLDCSMELAPYIPNEFIKISESGITSIDIIKNLIPYGFNGFLIGENFMKNNNLDTYLKEFMMQLRQLD